MTAPVVVEVDEVVAVKTVVPMFSVMASLSPAGPMVAAFGSLILSLNVTIPVEAMLIALWSPTEPKPLSFGTITRAPKVAVPTSFIVSAVVP